MPIGEFASASRLSRKALRLYGENGLVPPAWVDPDSGYRYYRSEQLRSATLIALLRRSGMPLAEIRAFLRDPTPGRLDAYERRATDEFAERRRVLRYAKRMLEEEPMYDVLTKRVGEQTFVSRLKRVLVPTSSPSSRPRSTSWASRTTARRSSSTTGPSTRRRTALSKSAFRRLTATSVCRRARWPLRRSAAASATSRKSSARTSRCTAGRRSTAASRTVRLERSMSAAMRSRGCRSPYRCAEQRR